MLGAAPPYPVPRGRLQQEQLSPHTAQQVMPQKGAELSSPRGIIRADEAGAGLPPIGPLRPGEHVRSGAERRRPWDLARSQGALESPGMDVEGPRR